MTLRERFTHKPQTYYALSIAATWAGIGSLMNGVTMTQTYGVIPSLIWVIGNILACILFGTVAYKDYADVSRQNSPRKGGEAK